MPVTEILLLRHGHRLAWTLDPTTGKYTSSHPFPTRLPADPPLASHGVQQAIETGEYFASESGSGSLAELVKQDRLRIYSSRFYRCLETLRPTVEKLREIQLTDSISRVQKHRPLQVRGETGIGEWFGKAWFKQPAPAEPATLKADFFPWVDAAYQSKVVPSDHGERIEELHDRLALALARVVKDVDDEYNASGRGEEHVTLLLCGHAAQIIATGRALTGLMPEDHDEEDFKCFTCGISRFVRRVLPVAGSESAPDSASGSDYFREDWRNGSGVAGGWDCVANSDCGHLSQGEERGWHFHGDESFDSYEGAKGLGVRESFGTVPSHKL